MRQPQELEVWYVLPAIRKQLAIHLQELGLKQNKIAELLGLTKSAVSQYLSKKRSSADILSDDTKTLARQSAKKIIEQPQNMIREIQKLCSQAKNDKVLCKLCAKHVKILPDNCKVCIT
ncbi:helix-turn-helix domain-containing protein [Candidatus Woesearchaeota archaeon]|nr:helix-turn-helix domain-containing protein [Candidatus Woesearchaeota archaeon]